MFTKNNQLEFEKLILITSNNELKKWDSSLYVELQKEKGTVKYITEKKIVYVHDTTYINSSKHRKINDSTYAIDWKFDIKEPSILFGIEGYSNFIIDSLRNLHNTLSYLTKSYFSLDLISGIKEVGKNKYATFARTKDNNPNVKFTEIKSAIIEPNLFGSEPTIILGPYIGYGHTGVVWSFHIGIGIMYKIIGF